MIKTTNFLKLFSLPFPSVSYRTQSLKSLSFTWNGNNSILSCSLSNRRDNLIRIDFIFFFDDWIDKEGWMDDGHVFNFMLRWRSQWFKGEWGRRQVEQIFKEQSSPRLLSQCCKIPFATIVASWKGNLRKHAKPKERCRHSNVNHMKICLLHVWKASFW